MRRYTGANNVAAASNSFMRAFPFDRRPSADRITSSTVESASIPAGGVQHASFGAPGRPGDGLDEPKSTTTGTPKAAAMCAGPLSFPMNNCGAGHQTLYFCQRSIVPDAKCLERRGVVCRAGHKHRFQAAIAAQVLRDRKKSFGGPGLIGLRREGMQSPRNRQ